MAAVSRTYACATRGCTRAGLRIEVPMEGIGEGPRTLVTYPNVVCPACWNEPVLLRGPQGETATQELFDVVGIDLHD